MEMQCLAKVVKHFLPHCYCKRQGILLGGYLIDKNEEV